MATSDDRLAWFADVCAAIRSRRFHILEPVAPQALRYVAPGGQADGAAPPDGVALSGDYADFLRRFGHASLFADHRDAPMLAVYPLEPHRREVAADGQAYVGFGFRGQQSAWFAEAELLATGQSRVYELRKQGGRELAPDFASWFAQAHAWCQGKFSRTRWQAILQGPPPFTPQEEDVVAARRQFSWRHIGFDDSGDAVFDVANHSGRRLPYLSVGVRGRDGRGLVGAVWLDVSGIAPGGQAQVHHDAYKDQLSPADFEAFELPDPIPEKREAYWEFNAPA